MSLTLPLLLELQKDIQGADITANLKAGLTSQFNRRFCYIYDGQCADFNPIYATATFLDPRYGVNTLGESPLKENVRQYLVSILRLKEGVETESDASALSQPCADEPQPKRMKTGLMDRITKQHTPSLPRTSVGSPSASIHEELTLYESLCKFNSTTHPLHFWKCYKDQLPRLHDVALSILVIRVALTVARHSLIVGGSKTAKKMAISITNLRIFRSNFLVSFFTCHRLQNDKLRLKLCSNKHCHFPTSQHQPRQLPPNQILYLL